MDLAVPESNGLALKAWELRLPPEDPKAPQTFEVPDGLGPGYVALVWKGAASLRYRDSEDFTGRAEGAFGIFSLENVAEIRVAESATKVQIAVLGVVRSQGGDPELGLDPRGKCGDEFLPMPEIPNGETSLTLVIRQLDFTTDEPAPPFPDSEKWPRPGFLLTTIDGPQSNSSCATPKPEQASSDPTKGELDLVALPQDAKIEFTAGSDKTFSTAFVLDFYATGDDAPTRDIGTEPGCYIRCWGP